MDLTFEQFCDGEFCVDPRSHEDKILWLHEAAMDIGGGKISVGEIDVLAEHPEWDEASTVTIIESAIPRFGSPEVTYAVSVYEADIDAIQARSAEGGADMTAVRGYSRTPAAKDDALTLRLSADIVVNGETGAAVRFEEKNP